MLYRKILRYIEDFLLSGKNKVLLIDGARQIGKSFIIRYVGKKHFENFVEINLQEDKSTERLFESIKSVDDFYVRLNSFAGGYLDNAQNTLVFLDEIQAYPQLLTLLKFLQSDGKYTYVASGSLLGIALMQTPSIPIGSIEVKQMYPLDFEEFLMANGFGVEALAYLKKQFLQRESLDEPLHNRVFTLFRYYLLTGGMPDAINSFLENKNIVEVRTIQNEIHNYYKTDASRYDKENKLKIQRVYDLIPSNLENKKKRLIVKNIEGKSGKQFSDYEDEFEYLIRSGITLDVKAISNPKFPLIESTQKNLLKLYLNDVGILSNILYKYNIRPILDEVRYINLGTIYESVVAQELKAHGHQLYYYDNKQHGEVDFLIDNYDSLSVLPIEVKSGRDYSIHSALLHFTTINEYNIKEAIVLSNEREIKHKGNITYMPIYNVMWL